MDCLYYANRTVAGTDGCGGHPTNDMIELTGVTKRYGALTAVDHVTLSVAAGEYCALLGPNGAGKTTLVRMLLHFTASCAGTIRINGRAVSDPRSRESLGYVPEQPRIPPHLTGWEYLARCAWVGGTDPLAMATECARIVQVIGMQGHEHEPARTYSKGMTQRFCLGAARLGNPRLLILDEPTAGLDPIGIREVRELLVTLKGRGTTLLLSSHLLSEVERLCDTAVILDRGVVRVKDTIPALVQGAALEDVFVRVVRGPQP